MGSSGWRRSSTLRICILVLLIAIELESGEAVYWRRQKPAPRGRASDLVLGIVSSKYAESQFMEGMMIENVEMDTRKVVVSFSEPELAVDGALYDPVANQVVMLDTPPHVQRLSMYRVQPRKMPVFDSVVDLDPGFCGSLASPTLDPSSQVSPPLTLYGMGGLMSKEGDSEEISCVNVWNVTEVDADSGSSSLLYPAPADGGDQPLGWMTVNDDQRSFVFFVPLDPSETKNVFKVRQINPYSAIPIVTSANSTSYVFYSMDWVSDTKVVGPCVDALHQSTFGICYGDYRTGDVQIGLNLPTNYNPKLTATYLDRERKLYVVASQIDPDAPQDVSVYVVDVSRDPFSLSRQYMHKMKAHYALQGLFLYPSVGDVNSDSSGVDMTTEGIVETMSESSFLSASDVLSASGSHSLTYVLLTLTVLLSCCAVIAVVLYMQLGYKKRLMGKLEQGKKDEEEDGVELQVYEVH